MRFSNGLVWVLNLIVILQVSSQENECASWADAGSCTGKMTSDGQSCIWCSCAAVPSGCYSSDLAKKLPPAVFNCQLESLATEMMKKYQEDSDDASSTNKVSLRASLASQDNDFSASSDDSTDEPENIISAFHFEQIFQSFGHAINSFLFYTTTTLSESEVPEVSPLRLESHHYHMVAQTLFGRWAEQHGKQYATEQEASQRFMIFEETVKEVLEHNQNSGASYTLGVNKFADLSWEEFSSLYLMEGQDCSATHPNKKMLHQTRLPSDLPMQVDWRQKGAVSHVKDQGSCGSCWTFSTTGCLEAHTFLKTGMMPDLSEQQLVDCAQAFDNHGCNGGLPSHAFEYIRYAGGLESEVDYPYTAHQHTCNFTVSDVAASDFGSVNITFQDEAELHLAVASVGPVSIAFQVASDFKSYAGGVYDSDVCKNGPYDVNHAVLAVGYDTDAEGNDYWIIKNSWGTDWGVGGYFNMARGKNMCGVADCASYPIV